MTQAFDIVVVGAGMVGAALATGLGQNGFRVALVDRAPPSAFDPENAPDIRVSALSAGSERYLQSLGAWDHILRMRATPYKRLAVWDETRYPLQNLVPRKLAEVQFDATELGAQHLGHIVENSVTQQALWQTAEACPQVTLFHGQGVASLAQSGDTATVTLDDGRELLAALVVGADGAQSRIRDLAGIGITRNQYDQQAMVVSVRYQGPVEDITWQGFHPSGPRAFLPLHSAGPDHPGESWGSLVWYDSPEELARLKSLDNSTLMNEIQSSFPASLPLLTHIDNKASFPIARQHAKHYHAGRVVLAGDSAHLVIPTGGLGMNTGVGDAIDLSWKLAAVLQGWGGPKLLSSYEVERRQVGDRNIGASRYASLGRRKWRSQWAPGFSDDTAQGSSLRENLARVADVEQRKTNEMIGAELGYRYVDSPLIWDEPGGPEQSFRIYDPAPWTGVRLPHIWVKPGVSIQDLIGRTYALLRMGKHAQDLDPIVKAFREIGAPITVLDFPHDRYRDLYGANHLLVRPDLHIAWRSDTLPDDPRQLAALTTGYPVQNMARYHAA